MPRLHPQPRPTRLALLLAAFAAAVVVASSLLTAAAEAAGPFVKIRNPAGSSMSGHVNFSAEAGGTRRIRLRSVSFFVDRRRVHVDKTPTWRLPRGLDTKRLRNGRHRLTSTASYSTGETRRATKLVTVSNPGVGTASRDTSAPAAPEGLAAKAATGQVQLDWKDNAEPDFSYYAVRRSTTPNGPWHRLPGNHTSSEYMDRSVSSGQKYYYFVTAMDKTTNVSRPSGTVEAAVPGQLLPAVPGQLPSLPLWSSDFEGNVLASWLGGQSDPRFPDRIRTVNDTARTGNQSMRVDLRPGDDISGTSRAQVYGAKRPDGSEVKFYEGDDYYFGFSTKLGSDYPLDANKWQVLLSWMRSGGGAGPLKLSTAWGSDFRLESTVNNTNIVHWRQPVVKGEWLDFVVRVHFSGDPSQGFVEVWYKRPGDDQLVRQTMTNGQSRVYARTFDPESTHSYLKAGLYRDPSFTQTSTAWYDSFKIGRRFEDVAPG